MDPSRPVRMAVLAALVAAAAVGLVALNHSGRQGAGQHASATGPSVSSRAAGHPLSDPSSSTSRPAPTTTTTTVPPATDPDYPLATVELTVAAHNNDGGAASVPTAVWYPDAAGKAPFPLVVFSPGYQITPSVYDPLVRAWAAAGYVVAEPTYPDTAPGAPQIEYDMVNHPGELSQVISAVLADSSGGTGPLAGMVDPGHVAVAGQSDGGDVSLAAVADHLYVDHRIKAAVILSGAEQTLFQGSYYSGTGNPPLLVVQGDADTINPPGCSEQLYDGAGAPRYYLELPGATHLSAYTGSGSQFDVVSEVSTAFLDGYLKGMSSRIASLGTLAQASGVSRLFSGAEQVPIAGGCPGAPAGA